MSIKSRQQIMDNINMDLADNNAGLISAADVRNNMFDIANSLISMVASGDFQTTPFRNGTVRIALNPNDPDSGKLSVGSGVEFSTGLQTVHYPGPFGIKHNQLDELDIGDPHPQYVNVSGTRMMVRNFGLGNSWINSSGNASLETTNNRGIRFVSVDENLETIVVGNKSVFRFNTDSSILPSAKGAAKVLLNFDGSVTPPVVRSSYNVAQLRKDDHGKFTIVFTSGTFANNNYVAIASSNARSDGDEAADFSINQVGTNVRLGNDQTSLRSMSFYVLNDAGQYVDAEINELVVYGLSPGENPGASPPVLVNMPTTTTSQP